MTNDSASTDHSTIVTEGCLQSGIDGIVSKHNEFNRKRIDFISKWYIPYSLLNPLQRTKSPQQMNTLASANDYARAASRNEKISWMRLFYFMAACGFISTFTPGLYYILGTEDYFHGTIGHINKNDFCDAANGESAFNPGVHLRPPYSNATLTYCGFSAICDYLYGKDSITYCSCTEPEIYDNQLWQNCLDDKTAQGQFLLYISLSFLGAYFELVILYNTIAALFNSAVRAVDIASSCYFKYKMQGEINSLKQQASSERRASISSALEGCKVNLFPQREPGNMRQGNLHRPLLEA